MSSRVQLALNVSNVDAAVEFYGKLFGAEPAKRRPGYANFAIAEPPLKLVLIENPAARGEGVTGALNHLGVEVASTDDVSAAVPPAGRRGSGDRRAGGRVLLLRRCRTRSGCRTPTARRGRSTPSWPTCPSTRRPCRAAARQRPGRGDRDRRRRPLLVAAAVGA